MKIDVPNELHEELLEKLGLMTERDGFDRSCWGKLYSILRQYRGGGPRSPRRHSQNAGAKARKRFR